jgi:hypothetical protein
MFYLTGEEARLITYFTGEEVEYLRGLIKERLELLEESSQEARMWAELITRLV